MRDAVESRAWWQATVGREMPAISTDYYGTSELDGVRHFALWPLSQAAENTFGQPEWPADVPAPQAWIELDVESPGHVRDAVAELEAKGHRVLRAPRDEEWGQTTARLLSPEGLLVGITFTPWLHKDRDESSAAG